ncbi:hypothetical protein Pelo_2657 [Pelomyxa schiedti]|nr:hypothetical protein Pelo_2657 [Pelomyxa schiedti]
MQSYRQRDIHCNSRPSWDSDILLCNNTFVVSVLGKSAKYLLCNVDCECYWVNCLADFYFLGFHQTGHFCYFRTNNYLSSVSLAYHLLSQGEQQTKGRQCYFPTYSQASHHDFVTFWSFPYSLVGIHTFSAFCSSSQFPRSMQPPVVLVYIVCAGNHGLEIHGTIYRDLPPLEAFALDWLSMLLLSGNNLHVHEQRLSDHVLNGFDIEYAGTDTLKPGAAAESFMSLLGCISLAASTWELP